jgi:hypothetical protein
MMLWIQLRHQHSSSSLFVADRQCGLGPSNQTTHQIEVTMHWYPQALPLVETMQRFWFLGSLEGSIVLLSLPLLPVDSYQCTWYLSLKARLSSVGHLSSRSLSSKGILVFKLDARVIDPHSIAS